MLNGKIIGRMNKGQVCNRLEEWKPQERNWHEFITVCWLFGRGGYCRIVPSCLHISDDLGVGFDNSLIILADLGCMFCSNDHFCRCR